MSTADPMPNAAQDRRPDPSGKADVPDADAQEQGQPAEGWASAEPGPAEGAGPPGVERSEADAAEQAQVVADEQVRTGAPRRDDVPEADWLEQTIAEPIDDEER